MLLMLREFPYECRKVNLKERINCEIKARGMYVKDILLQNI